MKSKDNKYVVFTDGSSRGNPGRGGWGAIVIDSGKKVTELGGGYRDTTNNRMELTAPAKALEIIPAHSYVTIYTDSSYVINGITRWVNGWKRNGWKTKTKEDVLNRDLWEKLSELSTDRDVKWHYVGGHVGILGNERCDLIATSFADDAGVDLYDGSIAQYDIPNILNISHDEVVAKQKKSDSSRSRAKAYSYISMVGGVIETHRTWAECEKRVKGARGARYKKSLDSTEEGQIIKEFSAK